MSVKLHNEGFEHALQLINAGEVDAFDENWDEVKPTHDEIVNFINAHFMKEYGLWFLGTYSKYPKDAKEHYVYPYGDLKMVQVSGLKTSLHAAHKDANHDIAAAAQKLLDIIQKKHQ